MKITPSDLKALRFPLRYWDKSKDLSVESNVSLPTDKVSIGTQREATSQEVKFSKVQRQDDAHKDSTPTPEHKPIPKKKWTILVYSAADNDLEQYMVEDVNEIENAGGSNNLNIVVQLDRGKTPSEISGGWKGARRFKIDKNIKPDNIDSTVLQDLGQVNMSDPKTLQDFIEWGMKNFPAQHYMLIISDHGAGWQGAIEDKSHKGWMSIDDMSKAITDAEKNVGKKLDIIGFDACLMGQTEVAYQLRNVADYMVASEETEGADGWPYQRILSKDVVNKIRMALLMKVNLEAADMAKFIVRAAAMDKDDLPTMSAIDLNKMDKVAKATDELAKAIIDSKVSPDVFKDIIRKTQSFGSYKDHYDFCRKLYVSEDVKDPRIKKAALKVMSAVYEAVILEEHSERYPDAEGLTIYLPGYNMKIPEEYKQTAFAKDTHWDEALEKFSGLDMADKEKGSSPKTSGQA